jgi:hypothetical protein
MSKNRSSLEHAFAAAKSGKKKPDDGFAFRAKRKTARDSSGFDKQSAIFDNSEKIKTSESAPETNLPNVAAKIAAPEIREKHAPNRTEEWLLKRGHSVTYALLFTFTAVLYFRPYEMFPALAGFSSIAWFLAVGTILIFVPSQLAAENSLTARPAEVNYVLLLFLFGLITIPVARNPSLAWNEFNDPFLKVVLIFIVIINVVRTERRLKWLIWLALAVGAMLAVQAIQNYSNNKLLVEGYRTMAEVKGMFGNPNAQSLHFITMIPIAIALGLAARDYLFKIIYFVLAGLLAAGNMVTFSRGGFLGLMFAAGVMAWKFGRNNRLQVMTICFVAGVLLLALAPGGYGIRVLSIFMPGLDPVGSSDQRRELLWTSIIVTLRNPWGIGMGNFPLTNPFNLVSHNSYTQVSSEMGVLALYCYIKFIAVPIRRLIFIEREIEAAVSERTWIYYLAIGLQASFAAWCVGSFFDAAAYQWFLYYLVAYAVCLRRVYQLSKSEAISPNLISGLSRSS